MSGARIAGGIALLFLLALAGALSFGLEGAVLGPLVFAVLFVAAIRAFAYVGANDQRDLRLVQQTRFRPSPPRQGAERESRRLA